MQRYLTIAEAASPLGLTAKALRLRLLRGQIPYRKLGARVLISAAELERFLAALPGQTVEEAVATCVGRDDGKKSGLYGGAVSPPHAEPSGPQG
jgi:excisionase family DNA binding protein